VSYLIDASNLGGVLAGRAGARDAAGVVRFLLPWARAAGRVVVVFDGPAQADVADRYGPLAVVWSGPRSADEVVLERARRRPGAWTVVTDDRDLARRCRAAGARIAPARSLAARVVRPHPADRRRAGAAEKPAASREEQAHWRRVFGVAPEAGDAGPADRGKRSR